MSDHQCEQRCIDPIESARPRSISPAEEVLRSCVQQSQHDQPESGSLSGGFGRQKESGPDKPR